MIEFEVVLDAENIHVQTENWHMKYPASDAGIAAGDIVALLAGVDPVESRWGEGPGLGGHERGKVWLSPADMGHLLGLEVPPDKGRCAELEAVVKALPAGRALTVRIFQKPRK